ncbi:MAG: DNA-directed polymerase [Myxococcales bacterium]|nr:DNA-directed polymerase [Myxococcales bacterium]
MSIWEGLSGQDRVVGLLRRAIQGGRVPHAYLFSGPPNAPLVDTAIALAVALNCEVARGEGCGQCDSCSKIIGGFHPDVVTLVREGAANIVPIESVRTQVIARIGLPPHEADVRVFVVEEATSMAPPAANALLKTLEEPPPRTLFVLCTTAPEQLLPTIRSRCQRVRFGGGGIAQDADPARAERIARLGDELAGDDHDPSLPQRVAEGKGDAALVLVAAATRLHAQAHAAAERADLRTAKRAAQRAQTVLSWHTAVAIHNANPALAIDALVAQLAQQDVVS